MLLLLGALEELQQLGVSTKALCIKVGGFNCLLYLSVSITFCRLSISLCLLSISLFLSPLSVSSPSLYLSISLCLFLSPLSLYLSLSLSVCLYLFISIFLSVSLSLSPSVCSVSCCVILLQTAAAVVLGLHAVCCPTSPRFPFAM